MTATTDQWLEGGDSCGANLIFFLNLDLTFPSKFNWWKKFGDNIPRAKFLLDDDEPENGMRITESSSNAGRTALLHIFGNKQMLLLWLKLQWSSVVRVTVLKSQVFCVSVCLVLDCSAVLSDTKSVLWHMLSEGNSWSFLWRREKGWESEVREKNKMKLCESVGKQKFSREAPAGLGEQWY